MKKTILAVILAAFGAAALPAGAAESAGAPGEFNELRSGRYALKMSGILCNACTRAIVTEVSKLDPVLEAKGDFDAGEILIVVKPDRKLSMASVRKALRKAARRADLKTRFEITSVTYRPKL